MPPHEEDPPRKDGHDSALIEVVRSGGFAGLRRVWTAAVDHEEDRWLPLVEACPWDDCPEDTAGRDRFVWHIVVRIATIRREAELPETALTGAWKELVTRVQEESGD
ncbi:protealysin inhibitor emfourin [Brevibacterium litoralis]|uniref:protealysin inhibitor emfourin n=1 Tax=Brevibacterium litoralis TaxID=3138935 RepID=UPI0032EFCABB